MVVVYLEGSAGGLRVALGGVYAHGVRLLSVSLEIVVLTKHSI